MRLTSCFGDLYLWWWAVFRDGPSPPPPSASYHFIPQSPPLHISQAERARCSQRHPLTRAPPSTVAPHPVLKCSKKARFLAKYDLWQSQRCVVVCSKSILGIVCNLSILLDVVELPRKVTRLDKIWFRARVKMADAPKFYSWPIRIEKMLILFSDCLIDQQILYVLSRICWLTLICSDMALSRKRFFCGGGGLISRYVDRSNFVI